MRTVWLFLLKHINYVLHLGNLYSLIQSLLKWLFSVKPDGVKVTIAPAQTCWTKIQEDYGSNPSSSTNINFYINQWCKNIANNKKKTLFGIRSYINPTAGLTRVLQGSGKFVTRQGSYEQSATQTPQDKLT